MIGVETIVAVHELESCSRQRERLKPVLLTGSAIEQVNGHHGALTL